MFELGGVHEQEAKLSLW